MNSALTSWICPACQGILTLNKQIRRCANNHSYDLAKEGYVNLLLAQHKNSKEPGDNKQMVNGRRAFLEQGHYQPLAQAVGNIFVDFINQKKREKTLAFFDAGCGEGYYLNSVSEQLDSLAVNCEFSGIDISKFAVQKAAKKYHASQFAVASTYHLPLSNQSQDGVLQIFAPSSEEEVHRVLKPAGVWIKVNPASYHLQEMKQALYDTPTQNKKNESIPEGFELTSQSILSFEVVLEHTSQRENLLMMTPYYWSASIEKKQALLNNLSKVTTDFDIRVYTKLA